MFLSLISFSASKTVAVGEIDQELLLVRAQRVTSCAEMDMADVLSTPAKQAAEEREWSSHELPEKVQDGLENDGEEAELGIIDVAADGDIEINDPPGILEQRYCELDRQVCYVRSLHRLP